MMSQMRRARRLLPPIQPAAGSAGITGRISFSIRVFLVTIRALG